MPATTTPPSATDIRNGVRTEYERVALDPGGRFHFHRGAAYAQAQLGYDPITLAAVPLLSTDRFAGVGNPHIAGPMDRGETVLDLGCGAGTDLLIAARRVGPTGRAIGVDMTPPMLEIVRTSARLAGLVDVVDLRQGLIEDLPVETGSVDVVQTNGVINLSADKDAVFREIARVLKPGGRLHLADVVVARPISANAADQAELWAACVAGALTVGDLLRLCAAAGLVEAREVGRHDAYKGTSAEREVSRDLRLRGATLFARSPLR